MKQRRKDNPELMKRQATRIKKRRVDDPEGSSLRRKKRRYNLSHEDWLKMWENQGGRCLICKKLFEGPSKAQVDHDHKTGRIRGLLCGRCNSGIAFFKEDLKVMARAIEYLLEKEIIL